MLMDLHVTETGASGFVVGLEQCGNDAVLCRYQVLQVRNNVTIESIQHFAAAATADALRSLRIGFKASAKPPCRGCLGCL